MDIVKRKGGWRFDGLRRIVEKAVAVRLDVPGFDVCHPVGFYGRGIEAC
jgi:hypothetical protein